MKPRFLSELSNSRTYITDEEGYIRQSDVIINLSKPIKHSSGRYKNVVTFFKVLLDFETFIQIKKRMIYLSI